MDSTVMYKPISLYIRNIVIEGNKRTKDFIILRHLTFAPGDSISLKLLNSTFEENKSNLNNLQLFIDVQFNIKNWYKNDIDVYITVKERWYTLPMASFDIYDRNFNTWWVTHKADLRRVQYGGHFLQQNVRGRDEDLFITLLGGFAQRVEVGYSMPFINKQMNFGLKARAYATRNRTLQYYNSENNEQFFWEDNQYLRNSWGADVDFTFKPHIHLKQIFSLGYNHASISDTIYKLNSFYFDSSKTQQYLAIRYSIINDHRDWATYPLKGSYVEFTINKTGTGRLLSNADITAFYLVYAKYMFLHKKWYASAIFRSKISFPVFQPYYNQRGLGYKNDYVAGYEYYVIDAQSYGILKTQLKYQLWWFRLPLITPFQKLNSYIPIYIYPKFLIETGYAIDQTRRTDNPLANTLLRSAGLGIDITTGYDLGLRIEYNVNHRFEKGLYLHLSGLF